MIIFQAFIIYFKQITCCIIQYDPELINHDSVARIPFVIFKKKMGTGTFFSEIIIFIMGCTANLLLYFQKMDTFFQEIIIFIMGCTARNRFSSHFALYCQKNQHPNLLHNALCVLVCSSPEYFLLLSNIHEKQGSINRGHNIHVAEIWLKLALNTNQSYQSITCKLENIFGVFHVYRLEYSRSSVSRTLIICSNIRLT